MKKLHGLLLIGLLVNISLIWCCQPTTESPLSDASCGLSSTGSFALKSALDLATKREDWCSYFKRIARQVSPIYHVNSQDEAENNIRIDGFFRDDWHVIVDVKVLKQGNFQLTLLTPESKYFKRTHCRFEPASKYCMVVSDVRQIQDFLKKLKLPLLH